MKTFDVTKTITILQRATIDAMDYETAEELAAFSDDIIFEDIDYRESIEAEETS